MVTFGVRAYCVIEAPLYDIVLYTGCTCKNYYIYYIKSINFVPSLPIPSLNAPGRRDRREEPPEFVC